MKDAIGDVKEIAALLHRLTNHEHPCQEDHHLQVYGPGGIKKRDLAGEEDRYCPEKHYLPDLDLEVAHLPDGDEDQNSS
ncbi:Uncharacterised protein [uncultured archaeon]|nr:Uncharacterised protein [uncultured archaeon]